MGRQKSLPTQELDESSSVDENPAGELNGGWEEDTPVAEIHGGWEEDAVAAETGWEDGVWEDGADGGWEETGGDEEQAPDTGSSFTGSNSSSAKSEIVDLDGKNDEEGEQEEGESEEFAPSEDAEEFEEEKEASESAHSSEKRLPVLPGPLLAEVRWLAHKVAQSSSGPSDINARPQPDETARLLALLMQLPTFNAALSQLRPRARLVAVACLVAQHLGQGQELLGGYRKLWRVEGGQILGDPHEREEDDEEKPAQETAEGPRDGGTPGESPSAHSHASMQPPIDVASLVLAGSAAFLVDSGGSTDIEEILPGSEVSVEDFTIRLSNKTNSSVCAIATGAGVEILSLPEDLLQMAAAAEEVREESRVLVLECLRCNEPWNREFQDVQVISSYLQNHVPLFADVSEEVLSRLCQQVQLIEVPAGGHVLSAGSRPDGMHVLLRGTAAICWPGAAEASPQVLRCSETWFCEDDSFGDWELCCQTDRSVHCTVADVIAVDEDGCEIMLVPRSSYANLLRDELGARALGQAAVQAMCVLARSELESIQPVYSLLSPYSPFLKPEKPDVPVTGEPGLAKTSSAKSLVSNTSQSMRRGSGGRLSETSGNTRSRPHSRLTHLTQSAATLPELEESSAWFQSVQQWALETAVAAVDGMVEHLPQHPALVQVLPFFSRSQLYRKAKLLRASRGQVIYRSGDKADSLLLVISGQVGVFDRKERQPTVKDRQMEVFKCVPFLAQEHLWTHGVPPAETAEEWLDYFHGSGDQETSSFSPLAACLLHTIARRWKGLPVPELGSMPAAGRQKLFISNAELEEALLGHEAYWMEGEVGLIDDWRTAKMQGESYIDLDELGLFMAEVGPGECLGAGAPGALEVFQTQRYSAVALSERTDILVFDQEAVAEVLADMGAHLPPGKVLAESLREGSVDTPKDLHMLSKLLWAHQTFAQLESRVHAELCRHGMKYVAVKAGETLCKQGDKAVGFHQLLSGSALVLAVGSKLNEPEAGADRPEGALVLRLGEGGAFGEDMLSRDQSCGVYNYTVVADTDVEVVFIEQEPFRAISHDWWGSAAARQKAVERVSGLSGGILEELGPQIIQVFKDTPLFKPLCDAERMEIAKQAAVLPVPLGGRAFDLPKGEAPPFCFVLKGCIGRYPGTEAESVSVPTEADRVRTQKTMELAKEQEQLFRQQQALLIKQREVQRLRQSVAKLAQQQAKNPLSCSLEQRLRLHALRRNLAEQILELGTDAPDEDAELPEPELEKNEDAPENKSKSSAKLSADPIGREGVEGQPNSLWRSPAMMAAVKAIGLHSRMLRSIRNRQSTPDETAAVGSSFGFLTSVDDAFVADEADLEANMNSSTAEYYEGDDFGGWQARSLEEDQDASQNPDMYRAHADTILLVVTRAAYEHAIRIHEKARMLEREDFLNRCLPVTLPKDALEKLVALFKEDPRPKDSVLVRKGEITTTVWLITEGSCTCRGSAESSDEQQESKESKRAAHQGLMLHPRDGRLESGLMLHPRDGMSLGTLEEGQFIGLSSVLLHEPEPLTVVTASRVTLLRADQLHSSRLTPPLLEALKMMLLAKSGWHENRLVEIAQMPGQVNNEAERIRKKMQEAYTPGMLDSPFLRRKGQVNYTPGLFALDAVCRQFGNDVHPESEWAFTPQIRSFYINIRLGNVPTSKEGMKAVVEYEGEDRKEDRKSAEKERLFTARTIANSRFVHYQQLTKSNFESNLSAIMETSATESFALAAKTTEGTHLSRLIASKSRGSPSQLTSHGGTLERSLSPPRTASAAGAAAGPPFSAGTDSGDSPRAISARPTTGSSGSPKRTGTASTEDSVLRRRDPIELASTSRAFQASEKSNKMIRDQALHSETILNQVRISSTPKSWTYAHADEIRRNNPGHVSHARSLLQTAESDVSEAGGPQRGRAPVSPLDMRILSPPGPDERSSGASMAQGLRPLTSSEGLPQLSSRNLSSENSKEESVKMLPSKLRHLRSRMPRFEPDVGGLGVGIAGGARTAPHTAPESTRSFRRQNTRPSMTIQKAPSFRGGTEDLGGLRPSSLPTQRQNQAFDVTTWGWADNTGFAASSGASTPRTRLAGSAG